MNILRVIKFRLGINVINYLVDKNVDGIQDVLVDNVPMLLIRILLMNNVEVIYLCVLSKLMPQDVK